MKIVQAYLREKIKASQFHPSQSFTVFSLIPREDHYTVPEINQATREIAQECFQCFGMPMVSLQPLTINSDRFRWYMSAGGLFYFKDPADAMLFKLTYS